MPLLSCLHTLRMRMLVVVFAGWIFSLHLMPNSLLSPPALAQNILGFTEQVSPNAQSNATEPSVAVDRSDGTVYVAWQASGTHVARSDDGGRTFVETPIANLFGSDVGDVDVRVGGPTPSGTHRVYVSSLEELPLVLQTHVAYSDDRGATWTINNLAAVNPSFIDRPWLAVFPSKTSADRDQVWVAHSPPAVGAGAAATTNWVNDAHLVFDGNIGRTWQTNTDRIFATLAVDDSGVSGVMGNVYSVFPDNLAAAGNNDIWFTHSSNKGQSWAPPRKVNRDTGTHYFPWIAAGSTGRVDFIWLTTPDLSPSDTARSPWTVTFAQTTNGTSATPKFSQTSASSNVTHVGGICTNGIFCTVTGGNRDLADSISIAIDRGGSAALVWTDQGSVLHGPTHITYACVNKQQSAIVGANQGQSCKGPAGP